LLDQLVLRLLPVRDPERIVIVRETGNHYGNSYGPNTISWPMFEDLRDNNQVFSGMFCRFPATVTLGYGDRAAQIPAELVSGSYFPILGIGAALGRPIAPDDDAVPWRIAFCCASICPRMRPPSLFSLPFRMDSCWPSLWELCS